MVATGVFALIGAVGFLPSVLGIPTQTSPRPGLVVRQKGEQPGCGYSFRTDGERDEIWRTGDSGHATGDYLDDFIASMGNDPKDWVHHLASQLEGRQSNVHCISITGNDCNVNTDCVNDYDDKRGYWVLRAVSIHYEIMKGIYGKLTTEALRASLSVPRVAAKWGNKADDSRANALDILLNTIGMAYYLVSGGKSDTGGQAKVGIGMFLGAIPLARLGSVPASLPDPQDNMMDAIYAGFSSAIDGVECIMSLAHRDKPSSGCTAGIDDLPHQTGNRWHVVSRYFDDGKWLVGPITDYIDPFIDGWKKSIQHAMIVAALKANGFFIFIDVGIQEKDCEIEGNGKYWVYDGVGWHCADLWKFDNGVIKGQSYFDDIKANGGHAEEIDNMEQEEGFDFRQMYDNAFKCARAYPRGDGKPSTDVNLDGLSEPPECFYNIPVLKGERHYSGGTWLMSYAIHDFFCSACPNEIIERDGGM